MSAAMALKAARDSGVTLGIDGDDLILEACSEPPAAVIDLLSRHKAEVLAMLAAAEYECECNEHKRSAFETPFQAVTLLPREEPALEKPFADRRGRVEECGGVLLHFCVECGRFGPYGYGVHLRAGRFGQWYCYEHRPQEHENSK